MRQRRAHLCGAVADDDHDLSDSRRAKIRGARLDDALAEAWRIARSGGTALRLTRRHEPVFDEEELKKFLDRMTELDGEKSGRGERELAALVLKERSSDEAQP